MRRHNNSRKRLYLRRTLAVVFFVVSLTLASLRSGALVYAMLYLSVLLPVMSAAYTLYVYRRMCISQVIDNHFAVKNEPIEYTCILSNETSSAFTQIRLVPLCDLSQIVDFDSARTFSLAPGEREEIYSPVICRRRGVYSIGIDKILISDILGIMSFSFSPPEKFRVTVYPRIVHLDSFGLFDLEGIRTRQFRTFSETEPADTVRNYEPGDDPRLLHWKASARTGTLKVRQLGDIERPSIMIAVDTKKYSNDSSQIVREDNLLEALLAICDYCAVHGIPVDVFAQDRTFMIRSYKDVRELYDWSCRMTFGHSQPDIAISKRTASCCALLTTGRNMPAMAQLELEAAAGAECVLMEFGECGENAIAENSRLKVICVPDDCRIERLLA